MHICTHVCICTCMSMGVYVYIGVCTGIVYLYSTPQVDPLRFLMSSVMFYTCLPLWPLRKHYTYQSNGIHYNDVIIGAMASQITSLAIVYSIVYSRADQRTHHSSASVAFVWGIHRRPVNSPHKGPETRKIFSFDDVIIPGTCFIWYCVQSSKFKFIQHCDWLLHCRSRIVP